MGNTEAMQLEKIAAVCGTPSPEVWPDVVNLPLFATFRPRKHCRRQIRENFCLYVLHCEMGDECWIQSPGGRARSSRQDAGVGSEDAMFLIVRACSSLVEERRSGSRATTDITALARLP
jgi:hypothetical protein